MATKTSTVPVATTPANLALINKTVEKAYKTVCSLWSRYQSERGYESITEYSVPFKKLLAPSMTFVKAVARPFGFVFNLDGKQYQVFCTNKSYGWKRLADPKPCPTKAIKIKVPARIKSDMTAAQRRALAVIQGRAKPKAPKAESDLGLKASSDCLPKTPRAIAKAIFAKMKTDKTFAARVRRSPEPYRAMIYESGLVPNARAIDGTARYGRIVDALEAF